MQILTLSFEICTAHDISPGNSLKVKHKLCKLMFINKIVIMIQSFAEQRNDKSQFDCIFQITKCKDERDFQSLLWQRNGKALNSLIPWVV